MVSDGARTCLWVMRVGGEVVSEQGTGAVGLGAAGATSWVKRRPALSRHATEVRQRAHDLPPLRGHAPEPLGTPWARRHVLGPTGSPTTSNQGFYRWIRLNRAVDQSTHVLRSTRSRKWLLIRSFVGLDGIEPSASALSVQMSHSQKFGVIREVSSAFAHQWTFVTQT